MMHICNQTLGRGGFHDAGNQSTCKRRILACISSTSLYSAWPVFPTQPRKNGAGNQTRPRITQKVMIFVPEMSRTIANLACNIPNALSMSFPATSYIFAKMIMFGD